MLNALLARLGLSTAPWPTRRPAARAAGTLPGAPRAARRGLPGRLPRLREACPTGALDREGANCGWTWALPFLRRLPGRLPRGADRLLPEPSLAARRRKDLVLGPGPWAPAAPLAAPLRRLFGRSLKLRQVSAGGCNACEADCNVLTTVAWDLGRFGVQFVASPRHADGVLVTGPVTANMRAALLKTYQAIPAPKLVIAVGACALGGGPHAGSPVVLGGVAPLLPVDLWIPGCPPHPLTTLDGLLRLLGRI